MNKAARLNELSSKLLNDLYLSFVEHGPAAIEQLRQERPWDYLRIIASLVPKQVEIQTDPFDGISDTDLAAIVALAQSQTAGVA
jgi:hypothetical protein